MMKAFKMTHRSQPCWDTPVIPEPGSPKQEDLEFVASLSYDEAESQNRQNVACRHSTPKEWDPVQLCWSHIHKLGSG